MFARSPPITPLPLPRGLRTLLVFYGAFDPPHFCHTIVPWTVVTRLYGDSGWLLYVPAAQDPATGTPVASDAHRLAMLKLSLDIPGRRSIWADEIDHAAWLRAQGQHCPIQLFQTLNRLRKVVPRRIALRLLIGGDAVAGFHEQPDARKIITLAEPLVMARGPVGAVYELYSSLDQSFWSREERAAWSTRMAPNFPMPASSAEVRDAIPGAPKKPKAWENRKSLCDVTTSVAAYIVKKNLYNHRRGQPKQADMRSIQKRAIAGDGAVGRAVMKRAKVLLPLALAKMTADFTASRSKRKSRTRKRRRTH